MMSNDGPLTGILNEMHFTYKEEMHLPYDVASESVIKPCIKNNNPLVD